MRTQIFILSTINSLILLLLVKLTKIFFPLECKSFIHDTYEWKIISFVSS